MHLVMFFNILLEESGNKALEESVQANNTDG